MTVALDDSDELVTRDSRKGVVPAPQLEVRVADAREKNPDQGEAPARRGPPRLVDRGAARMEEEGAHGPMLRETPAPPPARATTKSDCA